MTFNTQTFCIFFLLFYAGYWGIFFLEKRGSIKAFWRLLYVTIASAVFYGWWDWRFLFLILFTGSVDFWVSRGLQLAKQTWLRKVLLGISLTAGIGTLAIFKYSGFIADSLSKALEMVGISYNFSAHIPQFCLILPVGISFYTFQSLSYTIDVYRKNLQPTKSFVHFFSYLILFPQLVAGPIVRASVLLPQTLKLPQMSPVMLYTGMKLIIMGFFKKCVLADNVAVYVNMGFANIPAVQDTFSLWLIMILFSIQIYCDFSGYSDIARGLIKMMGYRFDLNFNHPELAHSMKNFWERWHISLSSWFRDYVYIPLGGSRSAKYPVAKGVCNMFITMFLSGLWHGAAWNFVFWGIFHGVALAVERITGLGKFFQSGKIHRAGGILICQITVLLSWVLFRARDFAEAVSVYKIMFFCQSDKISFLYKDRATIAILLLTFIMIEAVTILHPERIMRRYISIKTYRLAEYLFLTACILCAIYFRGDGNVFIYFQF